MSNPTADQASQFSRYLPIALFGAGLLLLLSLTTWQLARYIEASDKEDLAISQANATLELSGYFYCCEHWMLDNTPQSGAPGYTLVSLFLTDSRDFYVVGRGWYPSSGFRDKDLATASIPNQKRITLKALPWLTSNTHRADTAFSYISRDANQQIAMIQTLDLKRISNDVLTPVPLDPSTMKLIRAVDPIATDLKPIPSILAWLTPGRHLGYAITWFLLALAWIGMALKLRSQGIEGKIEHTITGTVDHAKQAIETSLSKLDKLTVDSAIEETKEKVSGLIKSASNVNPSDKKAVSAAGNKGQSKPESSSKAKSTSSKASNKASNNVAKESKDEGKKQAVKPKKTDTQPAKAKTSKTNAVKTASKPSAAKKATDQDSKPS